MPITAAERAGMLAALKAANDGQRGIQASSAATMVDMRRQHAVAASAPKERRSSAYAREGTAAHFVAQQALEGIRQPDEWTDRMVQLDKKVWKAGLSTRKWSRRSGFTSMKLTIG